MDEDKLKEDPFHSDLFYRKIQIERLYNLIKKSDKGFVTCIDAPFGIGKTTFFKRFESYINNSNDDILCVYFDAWSNDFFDNPLVAMISSLKNAIIEKNNVKVEDVEKIVVSLLGNLTKLVTRGIVDVNDLNNKFKEDTKREIISEFELEKERREMIRAELIKIATNNQLFKQCKVVFFVDELDRCKPSFALNFIETIKHFFDIKNYYFIMAMDKNQLGSTVQKYYGEKIDADGYLRRFIDFDFTLSPISTESYINELLSENSNNPIYGNVSNSEMVNQWFLKPLIMYTMKLQMSLRDIDKLLFYLNLIKPIDCMFYNDKVKLQYDLMKLESIILSLLLVCKVSKPNIYASLINGHIVDNDIAELKELCRIDDYILKKFEISSDCISEIAYAVLRYNNYKGPVLKSDDWDVAIYKRLTNRALYNRSKGAVNLKAYDLIQLIEGVSL